MRLHYCLASALLEIEHELTAADCSDTLQYDTDRHVDELSIEQRNSVAAIGRTFRSLRLAFNVQVEFNLPPRNIDFLHKQNNTQRHRNVRHKVRRVTRCLQGV